MRLITDLLELVLGKHRAGRDTRPAPAKARIAHVCEAAAGKYLDQVLERLEIRLPELLDALDAKQKERLRAATATLLAERVALLIDPERHEAHEANIRHAESTISSIASVAGSNMELKLMDIIAEVLGVAAHLLTKAIL